MSELRDLAAVFREIQVSIRALGEHVAAQEGHAEQMRKSLHDLKNNLQSKDFFTDEQGRELKEIHTWMGRFSSEQKEVSDRIANLQETISDHRREINSRIGHLEQEVTQA